MDIMLSRQLCQRLLALQGFHLDYHLELDRRYYSVPYAWVGKTLDVRVAAQTIEVFHHGQRVAAHLKGTYKDRKSTRLNSSHG